MNPRVLTQPATAGFRHSLTSRTSLSARILKTTLCAAGFLVCLAPRASVADVLSQYNFGTSIPAATLAPTTQAPNVTATPITAGAGNTIDLTSTGGSAPYLRMVPTGAWATAAAAVTANAYFQFSLTANAGYMLNLASLGFDIWRGGSGTPRGYEVRTSVDSFGSTVQTGTADTVRPTPSPITVSLSGAAFQGLSTITFRIYSYAPASGNSVEYDNITLNGIAALLPFTGYTWTGATNGNWNTTTPNWSGPGTTYVDGTPASQVRFDDTGAIKDVTVTPANLNPNLVIFENNNAPYTLSGSALNISGGLTKNGTSSVTINNAVTSPSVALTAGSLIVSSTGTLSSANIAVSGGAALQVQPGGSLAATSGLQASGSVLFNNGAQTLASLSGAATGVTNLTDTTLTVTGGGVYAGAITGNGALVKSTGGNLALSGTGSNFSGGVTVNGGALELNSVTAAGTGIVTVNAGASLSLGANVANAITLAGGTLGASGVNAAPANLTVTAPSTVKTFNAGTGATTNDVIITGQLLGTGDINLLSINGNAPDSQAFRLRGPVSTYSGTITVNQSAKLELQASGTTGSPMGTGALVLTGGTTSTTNAGTFSIVNVRNNSANATVSDVNLGNNVRILGTGAAYFNMLGSAAAGSVTSFGELQIGGSQSIAAVSTASGPFTVGFASVKLTGGNATFTPQPVGNTSYLIAESIRLGSISETTPGSGIVMNGAATLTLAGTNTYTGPTSLLSGTTVLAPGATLVTTSAISVASGATFNTQPSGPFPVQAAQTLTVNGSMTGDTIVAGTLRGSGTVTGAVTALSGSFVTPGNSPGILTTKNLDLQAQSTLLVELAKAAAGAPPVAGADFDKLSATDATFGASPTVKLGGQLSLTVGSGIESGDVFTIISNESFDPVVGTFAGLAQGQVFTAGGQQFQISYADDSATPGFDLSGGNDVSLLAVPEPASFLFLLGGAALCSGRRRRAATLA